MNGVLSKDLPFARAELPRRTSTCYRNLFRAPIAAGKIEVETPFTRVEISDSQSNVNLADSCCADTSPQPLERLRSLCHYQAT